MTRSNEDAAETLEKLAEVYGALGDKHRRLAFERAAASVRSAGARLSSSTPRAAIEALPNVGASTAAVVEEYLRSGRVKRLEELTRGEFPRDFHPFVEIQGVGPRLAQRFLTEGSIDTLDDLERAARTGRIMHVRGVTERLRARILEEISAIREGKGRRALLADALAPGEELERALRAAPGVVEVALAGSARRRKPTVGDLDFVVAVRKRDRGRAVDAFATHPAVRSVVSRGEHTRVALRAGLEADLWVVDPDGWGAALSYATGSREHTLELRRRAQARGWSIKTDEVLDERGRRLPARTEEEFYATLGLAWIPPEMRENRGEIEAAEAGRVPELVALDDLRADLHMHTTGSDGTTTLERMVAAAASLGHEYVAVTDHSRGLPVPKGMDEAALLARKRDVAGGDFPIPVLVGAEVNILDDGSLSLDSDALEELDVVIGSVHSGLREGEAKITKRIVDAISTGLVDVLGHPTNRRLPKRPESEIDFERVFDAAAHHDVALEVDGSPERMDLPGRLVKRAKEVGCKFVIDSDAHAPRELANLRYGVAMARRGWLTKKDVLTTRTHRGFTQWLAKRA